ncbi:MAG TPA: hypothetical protein VJ895_01735 [Candidatus Nanoarchaeia archaeon]|nr:hypothetical protein [Candidatus Nanoarchaeia archaeon]
MKFYSPCKIIRNEKKQIYKDLRSFDFSEYESRKILLDIYSLKGEFLFKPARLGMMIWLRKKDWVGKEGFESCLENLVG